MTSSPVAWAGGAGSRWWLGRGSPEGRGERRKGGQGETRVRREKRCHQGGICPQVHRGKISGVIWAREEVEDCLRGRSVRAGGAVWGGRGIDGVEVALEFGAIAGAELGEGGSVGSRQKEFGVVDVRGGLVEDGVWRVGIDGLGDKRGVDFG